MTNQIMLETLMGALDDVPQPKITLAFFEACNGKPTGKVKYVKFSELAPRKKGEDEQ
jgi:hypothetical protein